MIYASVFGLGLQKGPASTFWSPVQVCLGLGQVPTMPGLSFQAGLPRPRLGERSPVDLGLQMYIHVYACIYSVMYQ